MDGQQLALLIEKSLQKKPQTITSLAKKSKNYTSEQVLDYIEANSQRFGVEKGKAFLKFAVDEQNKLRRELQELLTARRLVPMRQAVQQLKSKVLPQRPCGYWKQYLLTIEIPGVDNVGSNVTPVFYLWPNQQQQQQIVTQVVTALKKKRPQTFPALIKHLKAAGIPLPSAKILQQILAPAINADHLRYGDNKQRLTLPPPPLEPQILQIVQQQPAGLTWAALKKQVEGFREAEIGREGQQLLQAGKIHLQKKGRTSLFFYGPGNAISADSLCSLLTQLRHLQKQLQQLLKAVQPAKDKKFGNIYPQQAQLAESGQKLFQQVQALSENYFGATSATTAAPTTRTTPAVSDARAAGALTYEKFVGECRAVSEQLMRETRKISACIWQVRERMPQWPRQLFDRYLRQLEQDGYAYLNEHGNPSTLNAGEKSGSIPDIDKGILFFLVWRQS